MKNITFKIAPKGEGKTRWLLNIAYKYSRRHKVYLMSENANEFSRFCDKYAATYHEVCPVYNYDRTELTTNDVVLIDNLFNHAVSTNDIEFLKRNTFNLFITIEGIESEDIVESLSFTECEQLSLFDTVEEENNEG